MYLRWRSSHTTGSNPTREPTERSITKRLSCSDLRTLHGFAWRALPPEASTISVMFVPAIGVISGAVLVGEHPRWKAWAALISIASAIACVLRPTRQQGTLASVPRGAELLK
jgi:hypothetical protein